ncbi:MmgE/PrpD family protein [Nocardia sp. NPDC005366]|uniref:MmgE/PrpD family protein n=1 Tax=Nocardia sp. NPDC005366 TaxID=3156878 RepID=UPI0033A3B8DC
MGEQTAAQALTVAALDLVAGEQSVTTSEAVRRTLLDWFAVTIAGSIERLPQTLAQSLAAGGSSRLVGRGGSADPATAALVNGTAAHTLELDDIYAPGLVHPGAPVVATALAVGDMVDATGRRFEDAVVAGIEVAGRVARALGPTHYRRWHTTGTAGALGSAMAAAYLLELDSAATIHSITLAATMAGGLQQTFRRDSTGKPLHAGNAAHAGVIAALAAGGGIVGALDALEGESGLAAATGADADWTICHDRSATVPVIEQLTVKPYPCCGHTFAAIAAALQLRDTGLQPDQVDTITVASYSAALDVAGNADPQTPAAARFSLAYTVATALTDGRLDQDSFEAARIADTRWRTLAERVSLEVGDQFEAAFPARRGASVTITTKNGDRVMRTVPDRPGSPENPLSTDAITAKFTGLSAPVLGAANAARLQDQLVEVAALRSVRNLACQPNGD